MGCVWVYMQKMELHHWWEHGDRKKNKLVEWKVLIDSVGIKSADLKINFCSKSFVAFQTTQM